MKLIQRKNNWFNIKGLRMRSFNLFKTEILRKNNNILLKSIYIFLMDLSKGYQNEKIEKNI